MKKKDSLFETEKIRVVHIITKLELGGAQVNTIYTYEHLNKSEFEAHLISGPGGILEDKILKKDNYHIINNLKREIRPLGDLKALFALRRVLKKIRPHIVHTHSSKAGILGRVAARLSNVPVIIHSVHGFSFSPFQSVFKRTLFRRAEKMVKGITGHYIFVARNDIQTAKQNHLLKNNFSLIRSGFPIQKFANKSSDLAALKERFNICGNPVICGIIAPLKPQKGLFHLLEIANRVIRRQKNVVFFIAGDGDLRTPIEAELKRREIFEYFCLPGFLFDIHRVLDLFDIGLSTALWEGLPQSLVQMRLKKIPLLVSDIPGNREVVLQGKNGFLIEVSDYDRFAAKILELIDDEKKRQLLGHFGDHYREWDAPYMVKEQEKLYNSLV